MGRVQDVRPMRRRLLTSRQALPWSGVRMVYAMEVWHVGVFKRVEATSECLWMIAEALFSESAGGTVELLGFEAPAPCGASELARIHGEDWKGEERS